MTYRINFKSYEDVLNQLNKYLGPADKKQTTVIVNDGVNTPEIREFKITRTNTGVSVYERCSYSDAQEFRLILSAFKYRSKTIVSYNPEADEKGCNVGTLKSMPFYIHSRNPQDGFIYILNGLGAILGKQLWSYEY